MILKKHEFGQLIKSKVKNLKRNRRQVLTIFIPLQKPKRGKMKKS